jgi:hypothetical protein
VKDEGVDDTSDPRRKNQLTDADYGYFDLHYRDGRRWRC